MQGAMTMSKNIILCSDGTGNQAIKGRGTNVFKIYEAIDRHHSTPQFAFYDDGVGTESFKLLAMLGGAFGFGLSRNVRDLYTHLARIYKPGDNIYLFGFSRGAYTVRTLAGFITKCGVLDIEKCENGKDVTHYIEGAYKAYRRDYKTITSRVWDALFSWFTHWRYGFTEVDEFIPFTHEEGKTPVRFIGVWDTVSAVGVPIIGIAELVDTLFYKFKFPNHTLDSKVKQACHAISIDDKRKTFHPELWEQDKNIDERIQQVWFSGVHSNVGGGYPKQGMSLVALDWMIKKAHAAGIQFIEHDALSYQQHADVHDKLYDSRSGLAAYYRYAPRNIYEICQKYGSTPLIHESVLHRSENHTDGYAPGNLPNNLKFVSSTKEGFLHTEKSDAISAEMGNDTSLLSRVSFWISLRKWLQVIFFTLTAAMIYLLIKEYSVSIITSLFSDPDSISIWIKIIKVILYAGLLIPVVVVILLSRWALGNIQDVFSSFWYKIKKATGL